MTEKCSKCRNPDWADDGYYDYCEECDVDSDRMTLEEVIDFAKKQLQKE